MKITKQQLKKIIKEELANTLSERGWPERVRDMTNRPRIKRHADAEKAGNVKFLYGPCLGLSARTAMQKGCNPGPCDHATSEEDYNLCLRSEDSGE